MSNIKITLIQVLFYTEDHLPSQIKATAPASNYLQHAHNAPIPFQRETQSLSRGNTEDSRELSWRGTQYNYT